MFFLPRPVSIGYNTDSLMEVCAMCPENPKPAAGCRTELHRLRWLVQGGFALFCLYIGVRFYQFYQWAVGQSAAFVPRPPAVEGFLPIGALVSLKRLLLTGAYDPIHPAGLTIFLAALASGLLLRKGFCGWICPVGFASNLVERLARRLQLLRTPPPWLDYPLLSLKYLLLGFFAYLILLRMDLRTLEAFSRTPYNLAVDARMLLFFLEPTAATLWVLGLLLAASLVLRNFWCRYLCPYGALLGILAWGGPLKIRRDPSTCINCRKCEKACPGELRVAEKTLINDPECLGCLECLAACPVKDCLQVSAYGRRPLPPLLLPLALLGLFLLFWAGALASGHWHSQVPLELLRKYYLAARTLGHP
jgi:polyferredoxin